mmetsp:Transcript_39239/g.62833  ORF Transcript_39239/g.62833 Transcript_39239/m.62833 type:complete len:129 (-) Transcript_39239:54-440(-)
MRLREEGRRRSTTEDKTRNGQQPPPDLNPYPNFNGGGGVSLGDGDIGGLSLAHGRQLGTAEPTGNNGGSAPSSEAVQLRVQVQQLEREREILTARYQAAEKRHEHLLQEKSSTPPGQGKQHPVKERKF